MFRSNNCTSKVSRSSFLVSRPRPPLISAASKPNCGGCGHVASSLAFARRSPKSCAAAGPVVRSGSVVVRLGNGLRTQQRPHTVTGIVGDGLGRRDTSQHAHTTRCVHTGTTFTQECRYSQGAYNRGRGNATSTPKDAYYIL